MDMIAAFNDVGSYRGAAAICGVDHKTVKRAVARSSGRVVRVHNYDVVADVVAKRVAGTSARISAKRLLPEARAAGYNGSACNFRRLVAKAKRAWRSGHHRGRRPGVWVPGEVLVIDWGTEAGLHIFCAVMAFSCWRFVRFVTDEKAATTFEMLAACFEELGGVAKVVLADRMGCLKGGVVADVVVPTPAYVRFASSYGFRPDFCEGHDPESKGIVENLVGYAKSDLVVPQGLAAEDLAGANSAAKAWCDEVNAARHSEICAVPAGRLEAERPLLGALPSLRPGFGNVTTRKVDELSCVRFGGARYSVPTRFIGRAVEVQVAGNEVRLSHFGELVAAHALVGPGQASVKDEHYGGARRAPSGAPGPVALLKRPYVPLEKWAKASSRRPRVPGPPSSPRSWPTSPPWRSPTAKRRWWRPWPGRPSSAGSASPTCVPSWRPGLVRPAPAPPARPWSWSCPGWHGAHCLTTPEVARPHEHRRPCSAG